MTRGEAVNWLINIMADMGKAEHRELWHYEQALSEIREMLESEPERKTGKWIPVTKIYKVTEGQFPQTHIEWVDATEPDEIDGVRCSECGTVYDFIEARNWCSECGARMER